MKAANLLIAMVLLVGTALMADDAWKVQKEFVEAVKKKDVKKIKAMLEKDASLAKKEVKYYNFPILTAAEYSSLEVVKLLAESGADIKQKDSEDGNTAVHYIARRKLSRAQRQAFLEYLVTDNKLKIDEKNKYKQTPLAYAFGAGRSCPGGKTGIELIDVFAEFGADLNAPDENGKTLLHHMATNYRITDPEKVNLDKTLEVAMHLANKKGVDVNLCDKERRTVLVAFLVHVQKVPDEKKVDFVKCLMENGASTRQKSKKKESAKKLVDRKSEVYDVMKKKYKKKR